VPSALKVLVVKRFNSVTTAEPKYKPCIDPITSADLDQTILDLAKNLGITFVIVSHELASIYAIANRIIMLDKESKSIIAQGDPRVLRDSSADPRVRQFFNRVMTKEVA